MELWHPPKDEAERFAWWQPLLLVSRLVREARLPWPVHLDEFHLAGRVDRPVRPSIWVYQHHRSGGALLVDDTGATYRYLSTPNGPSAGRFVGLALRDALQAAALHEFVEPIRYVPMSASPPPSSVVPEPQADTDRAVERHPAGRGRRGHLRLVPTGTSG
jgi:hypothetical protein